VDDDELMGGFAVAIRGVRSSLDSKNTSRSGDKNISLPKGSTSLMRRLAFNRESPRGIKRCRVNIDRVQGWYRGRRSLFRVNRGDRRRVGVGVGLEGLEEVVSSSDSSSSRGRSRWRFSRSNSKRWGLGMGRL
jgi:hypothetical protein